MTQWCHCASMAVERAPDACERRQDKITCRVDCEPNENTKPPACEEREQQGLPSGFT